MFIRRIDKRQECTVNKSLIWCSAVLSLLLDFHCCQAERNTNSKVREIQLMKEIQSDLIPSCIVIGFPLLPGCQLTASVWLGNSRLSRIRRFFHSHKMRQDFFCAFLTDVCLKPETVQNCSERQFFPQSQSSEIRLLRTGNVFQVGKVKRYRSFSANIWTLCPFLSNITEVIWSEAV